jgi:hypothetical protein
MQVVINFRTARGDFIFQRALFQRYFSVYLCNTPAGAVKPLVLFGTLTKTTHIKYNFLFNTFINSYLSKKTHCEIV